MRAEPASFRDRLLSRLPLMSSEAAGWQRVSFRLPPNPLECGHRPKCSFVWTYVVRDRLVTSGEDVKVFNSEILGTPGGACSSERR